MTTLRAVHQEGNIGSIFIFTIKDQDGAVVDISTATTLEAVFRPAPSAASFTRTAVFTTDGTDGKLQYVTVSGDLTPAGECWQRQARVVIPGLGEFRTFVREFAVKANL